MIQVKDDKNSLSIKVKSNQCAQELQRWNLHFQFVASSDEERSALEPH